MTPTAVRRLARAPLMGAVAGAVFYLGNLYRENGIDPRPAFGCDKPAGYDVVNLPAKALAAIYPIDALAPQQFGIAEDVRQSAAWSVGGFVGLGAGFYAVAGLVIGAAAGFTVRRLRRLPEGGKVTW